MYMQDYGSANEKKGRDAGISDAKGKENAKDKVNIRTEAEKATQPSGTGRRRRRQVMVLMLIISLLLLGKKAWDSLTVPEQSQQERPVETQLQQERPVETAPPVQLPPESVAEAPEAAEISPEEQTYLSIKSLSEQLTAQGDFESALACIRTGAGQYPQDGRYDQLYADCMEKHKTYILDTSAQYAGDHRYREAIALLDEAWDQYGQEVYFQKAADYRMEFGQYANSIMAAGKYNSAVILEGGFLKVVGDDEFQEGEANNWKDVTAVSIGDRFVMALHRDGTVSMTGRFATYTAATNPGWTDVIAISAGDIHAVALKKDGTLLAVGSTNLGQENVDYLESQARQQKIVSIAAGYVQTLALLADGTVIASGETKDNVCSVYGWENVASICAGTYFSAALLTDGTVCVTGKYTESFDASQWTDIDAIAAGDFFLVGLKSDGTLIAAALDDYSYSNASNQGQLDVGDLTDIVLVVAGHNHIIAMDRSGKLHCRGYNSKGADAVEGMVIRLP